MNDVVLADAGLPSRIERLTAALSSSTRRCYRNGWRKWEAFALEHGATLFPATPEALAAFVEHLAAADAKPTTIQTDLAGVSAAHRLAGATPNPTTTAYVRAAFQRVNRGFREAGGTVRQSAGITDDVMALIEAAAYQPRPRGNGFEPPATAKKRAPSSTSPSSARCATPSRGSARPPPSRGGRLSAARTARPRSPFAARRRTPTPPRTSPRPPSPPSTRSAAAQPTTSPCFGLSKNRIKSRITAAAKAAGLDGISSHGCRVGMAQDLARTKGIEMAAIMQGRRLAIGDDGSQVHRARECRTGRRGPVLCAERRGGVAGRSARSRQIPRPHHRPPPDSARRPTGRQAAREAGNGFRSGPRNPRDTPADGHVREADRRARDEADG